MDIDQYSDWAIEERIWVLSLLAEEDLKAVSRSCERLGSAGFRAFLDEHAGDIRTLFGVPKSEREPILHSVSDETERHALLIAAAYTARCAEAWLRLASDKGVSAGYAPAKSFLFLQAADAATELMDNFPTYWPFADLPDPFGEAPAVG